MSYSELHKSVEDVFRIHRVEDSSHDYDKESPHREKDTKDYKLLLQSCGTCIEQLEF